MHYHDIQFNRCNILLHNNLAQAQMILLKPNISITTIQSNVITE